MQVSSLAEGETVMNEGWFRVSSSQSEMVRNPVFRTPDCVAIEIYFARYPSRASCLPISA